MLTFFSSGLYLFVGQPLDMDNKKTATDENKAVVIIIEREHLLDNIIKQVTNNSKDPDFFDLKQDLLLSLLLDAKLPGIYERNELNYYLARLVMNNIASKTSPFYRIYKRPMNLSEPLNKKIYELPDE